MTEVKNYARFYALIKNIPGDHEELKENLVKTFTKGRTISLRKMSSDEYRRMCDSLPDSRPQKDNHSAQSSGLSQKDFTAEIKRKRSAVLKRMQELGVNTTDWAAIDTFCLDPRIAGKTFRQLSLDELRRLIPKLSAISAKPRPTPAPTPTVDFWSYERIVELTRNQVAN